MSNVSGSANAAGSRLTDRGYTPTSDPAGKSNPLCEVSRIDLVHDAADGRRVAQALLDRARRQRRVGHQRGPLVGRPDQRLQREAELAPGGVQRRGDQRHDQHDQLALAELLVVLLLHPDQLADQVGPEVARRCAISDTGVCLEFAAGGLDLGRLGVQPGHVEDGHRVGRPLVDLRHVLRRHAEDRHHDLGRIRVGQVLDDVTAALRHHPIQQRVDDLPHRLAQRVHDARAAARAPRPRAAAGAVRGRRAIRPDLDRSCRYSLTSGSTYANETRKSGCRMITLASCVGQHRVPGARAGEPATLPCRAERAVWVCLVLRRQQVDERKVHQGFSVITPEALLYGPE